jgi:hypothetical protein
MFFAKFYVSSLKFMKELELERGLISCSCKVNFSFLKFMKELETGAWSHRKGYQIERSSHQRLLHGHLPFLQVRESKTHMEQRDNTIVSLLPQVEELRLSQKEEMIGIKGRINNLEILSRKQCIRQLKVCAGEVRKWSVKMQSDKMPCNFSTVLLQQKLC